jgi:hypothetical protein
MPKIHGPSRNRRRTVAIACILAVAIAYASLVWWKYAHPPMFASNFAFRELTIIPSWGVSFQFSGDKLKLIDRRLNTVVFVLTGDRAYRGRIFPRQTSDGAVLELTNGSTLIIPRKKNVLFLFKPDGSLISCSVPKGFAEAEEAKSLTPSTDFERDFEDAAGAAAASKSF